VPNKVNCSNLKSRCVSFRLIYLPEDAERYFPRNLVFYLFNYILTQSKDRAHWPYGLKCDLQVKESSAPPVYVWHPVKYMLQREIWPGYCSTSSFFTRSYKTLYIKSLLISCCYIRTHVCLSSLLEWSFVQLCLTVGSYRAVDTTTLHLWE